MAAQPDSLLQRHLEREIPQAWILALNDYLWQNAKRDVDFAYGCTIQAYRLCKLLEKAEPKWGWPSAFDLESLFARYDSWKITVGKEPETVYYFDKL